MWNMVRGGIEFWSVSALRGIRFLLTLSPVSPVASPSPIFLRFPPHRFTRRVLHLEPIRRAAGAIRRALALRDDAFKTHFASVGEDARAVAFDMLVEAQAKASFGQHTSKRVLAHFSGPRRMSPPFNSIRSKG